MCSRTHVPAPPPCLLTSRPSLQLAMLTIRTRTTRHCSTRKNNTSSSHLHLTSSPPDHGAIYERTLCALGRGSEPWQQLLKETISESQNSFSARMHDIESPAPLFWVPSLAACIDIDRPPRTQQKLWTECWPKTSLLSHNKLTPERNLCQ